MVIYHFNKIQETNHKLIIGKFEDHLSQTKNIFKIQQRLFMNCLNCHQEFDQAMHVPRLLPHCGHTLCEICIKQLIHSNFIVCTECQQLNMAFKENDLPKNLAIMTLHAESKRHNNSSIQQFHNISNASKLAKKQKQLMCLIHSKKLEAFCLNCYENVCLQCVINHPKDHQLKTIEQAVNYFKDQCRKALKCYQDLKLNIRLGKISAEKTEITNIINMHKQKLIHRFSEIKNYIEHKETELITLLKSIYDKQLERIAEQEQEIDIYIKISERIEEISQINSLKEIVQQFQQNENVIHINKQKQGLSNLLKKDYKHSKFEFNNWEDSFSKAKEKIVKDIKLILQNNYEPKQKYLSVKHSHSGSSQNLSIHSKVTTIHNNNPKKQAQQNKSYKIEKKGNNKIDNKIQKQNKEIHISLRDLNFTTQSSQTKDPILIYGGYTEENQEGLEIYGSKHKFPKFQSSIGHVKFGLMTLGKKIYIFGGKKENKRIDSIFALISFKSELKEIGRLTKAKSGFGYCKRGSSCFIVGGNDGNILDQFQQYDFENQLIKTNLPKLNIARDELTAILHKNEIFAIGGYNLDSELSLSSVERYNFEARRWVISHSLNIQRRSHGSISLNSGLYVVGGYDGKNYLSTIQRFNQTQNRWHIVCEMMEQRCTFGIVGNTKCEGFYVFGGFAHEPMETCQLFLAQTKKCYPTQNLRTKRFMLGTAILHEQYKFFFN